MRFFAALLLLTGCASTAPTTQLTGNRYIFEYKSGLTVEAYYPGEGVLEWKALTGPSAGSTGRENATIVEVRDGLYFVSWLESSGTSVSNVIDLKAMRVRSFVTFAVGEERRAMSDEGTVVSADAPRASK